MADKCFPLVGGRVMRATRLDQCGNPDYGPCATVTSDGFVSVASTATIDEGETIELRNANGKMCVRLRPAPTITGFTVVVTFCSVDPALFTAFTGQPQVLDADTGDVVGFRVNTAVDTSTFAVALEVWSNVPSEACTGADVAYGYVLYPFLSGGTIGDYTIENNAVTFQVVGMETKSNGGWDVGPYNVINEQGVPAPLATPIGADDHLHVQVTYLAPPEAVCGCQRLDDPNSSIS